MENRILRIFNCKKGTLPCIYLRIPIDRGLRNSNLWDPLKIKMDQNVDSWKGKWLSWAGRLIMLQVVISILPIYLMSFLALFAGMNSFIIQKMRNFF